MYVWEEVPVTRGRGGVLRAALVLASFILSPVTTEGLATRHPRTVRFSPKA